MKTIWYIFDRIAAGTFVFWILETLFFIIRDGFHLKAVTADEIACDKIVTIGINISISLLISIIVLFLRLWKDADSITWKK